MVLAVVLDDQGGVKEYEIDAKPAQRVYLAVGQRAPVPEQQGKSCPFSLAFLFELTLVHHLKQPSSAWVRVQRRPVRHGPGDT